MTALASGSWFDSWGHNSVGVEGLIVPFVLSGLMESPVLIKIVAGAQGATTQHCLSTGGAPTGTQLNSHLRESNIALKRV